MNNNERQFRELADETKEKIRQSTANRPKSEDHKSHISQGMKKYWKSVPNRPTSSTNGTSSNAGM